MWEALMKALAQKSAEEMAAQKAAEAQAQYEIAPSVVEQMSPQPQMKMYVDPTKAKQFQESMNNNLGFYNKKGNN